MLSHVTVGAQGDEVLKRAVAYHLWDALEGELLHKVY